MKWLYFAQIVQLSLLLAIAPFAVHCRPSQDATDTGVPAVSTPATAPTPAPTVSTVLANDTAIANKFIDNLNLTDIPLSITNRRLHSIGQNLALIGKVQMNNRAESAVVAKAHQGIAVPMTMEELEAEMAGPVQKPSPKPVSKPVAKPVPKPVNIKHLVRTNVEQAAAPTPTTTAKDGITTWIPASEVTTIKSTTIGSMQKIDKIAKIKADAEPTSKPTSKPNKVKFVPASPKGTTAGSTAAPSTTVKPSATTVATPVSSKAPPAKKKASPTRPSTTTSTTTPATTTTSSTTESNEIAQSAVTSAPQDITSTTWYVLEPKDADFDLPQDRSPGKATPAAKKPKRPLKSGNKKKQANKNKTTSTTAVSIKDDDEAEEENINIKNSTKVAAINKLKQKPMTTQIYNYLSREIMPTVGVGLIGLVVTAGIAGYFLNPLGALRRSYEVADRKDDLYHYNNEEYAGPGQTDGQSEEEIFGKVIAGMPVHSAQYRNNIRYVQGAQQTQQQQQQQQQQQPKLIHRQPNQYKQPYSPVGNGAQFQRYRNVQHIQQPHSQHPGHYAAYAAHYGQQRNNQLNPNVLVQKSIASPMYTYSQQQQPIAEDRVVTAPAPIALDTSSAAPIPTTTTRESPYVYSSPSSSAVAASDTASASVDSPSIVYSYTDKSYTDQYLDTNPNELKRRSQFVVGSVVLADAQAAALTASEPSKYPSIVLPEHGPRRRRRRSIGLLSSTQNVEEPIADAEVLHLDDAVEARTFDLNVGEADAMYAALRKRYQQADTATRESQPILKEMKRLDYQVTRLRRVVAEAKDIEQFQSELSLEPKMTELNETLNNGLVQICSDIRFVGELMDDYRLAADKIAERSMMSKRMALAALAVPKMGGAEANDRADDVEVLSNEVKHAEDTSTTTAAAPAKKKASTTTSTTAAPVYTTTQQPSFFLGLLKMLELKSAFGVHVLRSIRPAFDRAVSDVFSVNQTQYNYN